MKKKNNIISDWLEKHGDPKIAEQVQRELKALTVVNNFDIIKPLLEFNSPDDFYFLQVLQRKKDAKPGMKVNGTNNNSRLIKAYYIKSIEHLEFVEPEIIKLCELFNARGGINLNKRSFEKLAYQNLKLITDNIINKNFDKIHKTYPSAAGKLSADGKKKWIIDIDSDEMHLIEEIKEKINGYQPVDVEDKLIAVIPSKSGAHLITSPFNVMEFKNDFPGIDIQKNNPTNLYIP